MTYYWARRWEIVNFKTLIPRDDQFRDKMYNIDFFYKNLLLYYWA